MFEYTLASDLHMDTGHFGKRLKDMEWSKTVLVPGDLGNGLGNFGFIEKMARKGHRFIACDGNHEHYANLRTGRSLQETEARFYERMGEIYHIDQIDVAQPRVWLLEGGLYLIMANGWYQVEDEHHWRNYMNDASLGNLRKTDVNDAAKRHADFVGEQLVKLPHDSKAIVMTHTAPTERSLDPRYEGSSGNAYYWNPMMEHVLVTCASSIAIWHHGHTHTGVDVKHAGVRILTNPRGYPGENPDWSPMKVTLDG